MNKKPLCSYCGILGHMMDKCYKKYGYPPNKQEHENGRAKKS